MSFELESSIKNNLINKCTFILKNNNKVILPSFANSFRRNTISNIETLGFKYIKYNSTSGDIIINENTSKINNDLISNNISLLNINVKSYKCLMLIYLLIYQSIDKIELNINKILLLKNIEQYLKYIKFHININNNSNNIYDITTENIEIFINDINLLELDLTKY